MKNFFEIPNFLATRFVRLVLAGLIFVKLFMVKKETNQRYRHGYREEQRKDHRIKIIKQLRTLSSLLFGQEQEYDDNSLLPRATKRRRLSWLTNSALVYEPKCGGWGVARSQPMSTALLMEPKSTLEI